MRPILIAGTNSWDDDGRIDWYCPGHPFGRFLFTESLLPIYDGGRPFVWSTNLAGVPWLRSATWSAGGAALAYFVIAQIEAGGDRTALIVHSHGLQVALYACAEHDLRVRTLVSIGSPVRKDMADVARRARPNIGYWLHVHSDGSDRWQWLGELFDGHLGIVREHPLADRNDFVPRVGHSQLLRDPAQYHYWIDRGWLDPLKG